MSSQLHQPLTIHNAVIYVIRFSPVSVNGNNSYNFRSLGRKRKKKIFISRGLIVRISLVSLVLSWHPSINREGRGRHVGKSTPVYLLVENGEGVLTCEEVQSCLYWLCWASSRPLALGVKFHQPKQPRVSHNIEVISRRS